MSERTSLALALCAIALICMGALSLAGWWLEIPYLIKISSIAVAIQPNSALCLFLSGVIVASIGSRNQFIAVVSNVVLFAISLLTLLEYIIGIEFGVDTILVINPSYLSMLDMFSYRMAPNTAVGFFMFSVFIFLNTFQVAKKRTLIFFIPCVYGVIGLISLVGYLININEAYAWGSLRVISPQASLGLILMSIASFALKDLSEENKTARSVTLLEYTLFSSVLVLVLILWQTVRLNYISFIKSESRNELKQLSIKMATEVENEVEAVIRLFSRLNNQSYASKTAAERDVANYFKHIKPLVYIGTKTPKESWNYFSPESDKKRVKQAVRACQSNIVNTFTINNFGEYLCVKDRSNIALFDTVNVIREFFKQGVTGHFIVHVQLDGQTIYVSDQSDPEYRRYWNVSKDFDLYGKKIMLTAQPVPDYILASIGKIPSLIFTLGLLVAFTTLFALRYRRNLLDHQRDLIASENLKDTLLNSALEGIIGVNKDFRISFMNLSAKKMLGYDIDNETVYFGRLLKARRNQDISTDSDEILLNTFIHGKSIKKDSDTFFKKDGAALPVSYSCSPLFIGEETVGALIVFADNTDRMKLENILRDMALSDSLTGLPNRAHFMREIEDQLRRLNKDATPFILCYIDVNNFKKINDTYGHHVGDLALKYVAEKVRKAIRKNDFFARLSGDEFCLLLKGIHKEDEINKILLKIRALMEVPMETDDHQIPLKLSIGVVSAISGETAENLMIRADKAMYASKNGN